MKCCALLLVLVALAGCSESSWRPSSERVWAEAELKGLQGKTRDEVREILGSPTGLYTIDAKGRWHYAHMKLEGDRREKSEEVSVMIYFSQFGEHRVTIIDIVRQAGNP